MRTRLSLVMSREYRGAEHPALQLRPRAAELTIQIRRRPACPDRRYGGQDIEAGAPARARHADTKAVRLAPVPFLGLIRPLDGSSPGRYRVAGAGQWRNRDGGCGEYSNRPG